MEVTDLFNLELKALKKKYGGSIKNETWMVQYKTLGLTPVEISVYRSMPDRSQPLVSIHWRDLLLIMNKELHIEAETPPSAVRWFMRFLELLDPELKDVAPNIFEEAESHEKRWDSFWNRRMNP